MEHLPLLSTCLSAGYTGGLAVLRDATLEVAPGEIVGLVGESGSGKSTMALALLRLLQYRGGWVQGEIRFGGRNLLQIPEKMMRRVRGREIGLVLQSPIASLNPAMRIGDQIHESWRAHKDLYARPFGRSDAIELLGKVSLPADEPFLRRYPRQLSVGQAQRVLIAMAIVHRPPLLLADEPTSALDAVTQAGILHLFSRLNRELQMGILYISHDLLSVGSICRRVAILSEGHVVEFNSTENIFQRPAHPYTKALIASIPRLPRGLSSPQTEREVFGEVRGEMELTAPRTLNLSLSNRGSA
jgi:ABC-type dipeptide/oligopeptide/nickel transport system ATPase component